MKHGEINDRHTRTRSNVVREIKSGNRFRKSSNIRPDTKTASKVIQLVEVEYAEHMYEDHKTEP
jgi:hypothetical protein